MTLTNRGQRSAFCARCATIRSRPCTTPGRSIKRSLSLAAIGNAHSSLRRAGACERVDGSRIPQASITDAQIRAFADLTKAMTALGLEGESLVKDFLGRGWCLSDIAARRGVTSERERGYIGWRLRECLNTLAVTFGYAATPKVRDAQSQT